MSLDDSPASIALRVAADLKSAAAELSDENGAARRDRYARILQDAESKLAPQQRPEFYDALGRWFPGQSSTSSVDRPTSSADSDNLNGSAGARTPDSVLASIRALIPNLSPREKQTFAAKLAEIGLASDAGSGTGGNASITLAPETLRMLGVPADAQIDASRLAPLVGLLVEVLVMLDAAAWDVWDSLGPETKGLKREVVMKKAIAMMLTGQTKLSTNQLRLQIAQLQRLTVELLAQMNKVSEYAMKHLNKIHPSVLMEQAEAEPRGWGFVGLPTRCWEKYAETFEGLQETTARSVNKRVALSVSSAVNAQRF